MNIYVRSEDGQLAMVEVRDWVSARTSLAHRRHSGTADVLVELEAGDGTRRNYQFDWARRPPDEYERRTTRWSYTDEHGGDWAVDYGYNGRYWGLFGPEGCPFGNELARTQEDSLVEASIYIAKVRARHEDRSHDEI
jgi:hypothetical protein